MNFLARLLFVLSFILLLAACSEKKQYEEAVLAEMQSESDIKDYKLDPATMTKCVVESTSRKMPGVFFADPERLKTYLSYTKMLSLKAAKDPQKVMEELRVEFGTPQGLAEARGNYTQSLVDCQTTLITNAEPKEDNPALSESTPSIAAPTPDAAQAPVNNPTK